MTLRNNTGRILGTAQDALVLAAKMDFIFLQIPLIGENLCFGFAVLLMLLPQVLLGNYFVTLLLLIKNPHPYTLYPFYLLPQFELHRHVMIILTDEEG